MKEMLCSDPEELEERDAGGAAIENLPEGAILAESLEV